MILLKQLREYFEGLADCIPGLKGATLLTVEQNMADKVNDIPEDDTPTLFYLPPSANGAGDPDSFNDKSLCVVFIMQKYNPRKSTSAEALEASQPIAEAVKAAILADSSRPCHFLTADISTISTLPETEFFGNWAGWSIGFTVDSN